VKVIVFGASGMIGQGVVRACLAAPDVSDVLLVGRAATGPRHARLREVVHVDLFDCRSIEPDLTGYDACFFSLGVSVAGLDEVAYTRVNYELVLGIANTLARLNPEMTFVYVSGQGTDSTEEGRVMWARVKGRTENALRRLPFKAVYLFRPGLIQPIDGVRSRTGWYQALYTALSPVLWLGRRLVPTQVLTTDSVAQAMLNVVRRGAPQAVLEPPDIYAASRA
jgi:uncharacterized protein YbjT (DUF2867 family)